MASFLGDIASKWLNVVTFGVVDYVVDTFIAGPASSLGLSGAYLTHGLAFQAKLSSAAMNPLTGITGIINRQTLSS